MPQRMQDSTLAELYFDAAVHAVGLPLGITGAFVLVGMASMPAVGAEAALALRLYAAGIVSMLGFSALYNTLWWTRWCDVLRRLDHAAIYVMISASFMPWVLVALHDWEHKRAALAWVWGVCALGVAFKLGRSTHNMEDRKLAVKLERIGQAGYLGLGWSAVAIAPALVERFRDNMAPVWWLLAGGAVYMVGFTFYINQAMHLQHPIWHVHVVVAAICHFWPVVRYLVPLDGSGPEYARRA